MFKKIGLRIRRVRMDQHIKQKDLAKKIGISQGALTNFELGRRNISLEWLVKISRALETPISTFLVDIEPKVETGSLAPKEQRLVRAFQKMSSDGNLQLDVIHIVERMGKHLERAGRGKRSR